jgi:hypothetical protein
MLFFLAGFGLYWRHGFFPRCQKDHIGNAIIF